MTTTQKMRWVSAWKQFFHANCAIVIQSTMLAFMVIFKRFVHTTSASIAMESVLSSSDPTNTAFITMIDKLFGIIVIMKFAYIAVIPSKFYSTFFALFLALQNYKLNITFYSWEQLRHLTTFVANLLNSWDFFISLSPRYLTSSWQNLQLKNSWHYSHLFMQALL